MIMVIERIMMKTRHQKEAKFACVDPFRQPHRSTVRQSSHSSHARRHRKNSFGYNKTDMNADPLYDHGSDGGAVRPTGRSGLGPTIIQAEEVEMNTKPPILAVYHVNTRSLRKQLPRLRSLAPQLECYDVIGMTETWLTDKVADSDLQKGFENHTWFRRDRGKRGGGVACAVRSSLRPRQITCHSPAIEMIVVHLEAVSVTVAICYRPPKDNEALKKIMDALASLDSRLIVVGDFNIRQISRWDIKEGAPPTLQACSKIATDFLEAYRQLGLKQWVCEPTRGENILDYVLTRQLQRCKANVYQSQFDTDHNEIVAEIEL